MDFFKLLQSLDELLYEVVGWLIFYPITMWRTLRHPLQMMEYADDELADDEADRYTDTLSPPIFLFLSLLLSHALELVFVGPNRIVTNTAGLDGLITSDSNLIVMRILLFSLFPLLMATRLVRQRKIGLDRKTLRQPFYSQCYVAAPFALLIGIAGILAQCHRPGAPLAAAGLIACALLWYGSLQIRWFASHLQIRLRRAFVQASIAMIECLVVVACIGSLFA